MTIIRRYRAWKLKRRIKRLLDDAGFPPELRNVFTGSVAFTVLPAQDHKNATLILLDELHRQTK